MRAHWQHFFPRDSALHVWGGSPPLLSRRVQHQSDSRPQWFRIAAFPFGKAQYGVFQACYPPGMRGAMWRHAFSKTMEITPWHAHIKNRFQLGGGRLRSYSLWRISDFVLYTVLCATCFWTKIAIALHKTLHSSSKGFPNWMDSLCTKSSRTTSMAQFLHLYKKQKQSQNKSPKLIRCIYMDLIFSSWVEHCFQTESYCPSSRTNVINSTTPQAFSYCRAHATDSVRRPWI